MSENKSLIIKLIRSVEKRKCIWDVTCANRSKRHKLELAWKEVAEEISKPESYCRDKWRNVRTGFLRSLKEIKPSGSATSSKKTFYLHDELQFLIPHLRGNEQTGNLSDVVEVEDVSEDHEEYRSEPIFSPVGSDPGKRQKLQSLSPKARGKREKQTDVDIALLKYLANRKKEVHGASAAESSWISFFKGLIPDILPLPENKQRLLKRKFVEIIGDMHGDDGNELDRYRQSRTFLLDSNSSTYIEFSPSPNAVVSEGTKNNAHDHEDNDPYIIITYVQSCSII